MSKQGKKWSLLLATAVLAVWLGGCAAVDKENGGAVNGETPSSEVTATPSADASPSPEVEESEAPATPTPDPNAERTTVTLHESDGELMDMVTREVEVFYTTDEELIAATIAELQKEPGNGNISLMNKIEVKSLTLEGDRLVLDIHIPQEGRFGTSGELMLVSSLQQTAFQFDFINELDILLDGEAVDSLMGHVELLHPITRESQ
ncbi:GerMN domain-containing protein [Paenibacillus sp. CAU 1782]